jgi:hypothetical protein
MKRFDLYIANPAHRRPEGADMPFDLDLLKSRGLLQMDLPFDDAKKVLNVVKGCGANAYLVPMIYRHPIISIQEAKCVALKKYSEMIEGGRRLASLDDGYDDVLWWTFCADDIEAVENDLIPGRICISVDKLDGHTRSQEEFEEWLRLSTT